jgi:SAM-dependent methyltransferase
MDREAWDRTYATGRWDYLGDSNEIPRFAVIAGYSRTMGCASSVLDIGCGAGHLFAWLGQDTRHRYLGIDISAVAIEQARKHAVDQARFEVADAAIFDPGARFDIIVFNEVLYYMINPHQVLDRYKDFLAPNGVFIISMWRSAGALRAWRLCASRLQVLNEVVLRSSRANEWHVRLCRPKACWEGPPPEPLNDVKCGSLNQFAHDLASGWRGSPCQREPGRLS